MPETELIPIHRTSIGRKLLMAASSMILFIYVVGHLAGNLKVFTGPDPFNHYAEWLRVVGSPLFPDATVLWVARVVLLAALLVHVGAYVSLWREKRSARSTRYRSYDPQVFNWTSRTMAWGGIALLGFVVFHVLHLTTGHIQPDPATGFEQHDPYANLIAGFSVWWVTGIYVIGVMALGMHLYHGLWSAMQTFGMSSPAYNRFRRPSAAALSLLITIGYLIIPIAVLTGMVR